MFYKQACVFTGVNPEGLLYKMIEYISYCVKESHPERRNFINPNLSTHKIYGDFRTPSVGWEFQGIFTRPEGRVDWDDVEIRAFHVDMLDGMEKEFLHPITKQLGPVRNEGQTSFTLQSLMDFQIPKEVDNTIRDVDRKKASSVVYSVLKQMFGLDADTSNAWAEEYAQGDMFDYEDPYSQDNVKKVIQWANKRTR